jgi:hypothetical protein
VADTSVGVLLTPITESGWTKRLGVASCKCPRVEAGRHHFPGRPICLNRFATPPAWGEAARLLFAAKARLGSASATPPSLLSVRARAGGQLETEDFNSISLAVGYARAAIEHQRRRRGQPQVAL